MLPQHTKTFAALLSAGVLGAVAPASAQTAMSIATVSWIGYGPFYVAESLDLFKKYGLKVSYKNFSDPALIPAALASGAVDGALLTYDQVVGEVARGRGVKVVMPVDYSAGGDAILAETSIKSVADFKGKAIAYNPLSPSDFLLSYALQQHKLAEKDIKPVNSTPETVPAAMASGQVKIGVTYEPSVSQILADGKGKYRVIYSSKDAPGLIADVLTFTPAQIAKRGKDVQGVMKAYLDGLAYMKAKPEESAVIIGKALGVSAAEAKDQLKGVYNIPLAEMPNAFAKGKDTTSYYVSGEVIGKLLMAKKQIPQLPDLALTMDAAPLKSLK